MESLLQLLDYDHVYFESLRSRYYSVMNFLIKISSKYNGMVRHVDNKHPKVRAKNIELKILCYQSGFLRDVDIFHSYTAYNPAFSLRQRLLRFSHHSVISLHTLVSESSIDGEIGLVGHQRWFQGANMQSQVSLTGKFDAFVRR